LLRQDISVYVPLVIPLVNGLELTPFGPHSTGERRFHGLGRGAFASPDDQADLCRVVRQLDERVKMFPRNRYREHAVFLFPEPSHECESGAFACRRWDADGLTRAPLVVFA
jgi:hypothetical protein